MQFGSWLKTIEEVSNRIRLWVWIIGAIGVAVAGGVTMIGYLGASFGAAPLYQLIPAVLLSVAATMFLVMQLRDSVSDLQASARRRPSFVDNMTVFTDVMDKQTKLSFIPNRNLDRLCIRLEWSSLLEGVIGVGDMWSEPNTWVIAELTDVVRSVRQVITLTEIGEKPLVPFGTHKFLRFPGINVPIHQERLFRGRIGLILEDNREQAFSFFAVSYPRPDLDRPIIRVIDQDQFDFLSRNWQGGAVARSIISVK